MNELWQLVFVLLVLFVLAEAVAILALARAIGLIHVRLGPEPGPLMTSDGLDLEMSAPPLRGHELGLGRWVELGVDKPGRWAVVFVTPTCSLCREVVRAADRVARDRGLTATLVLVAKGPHEQNMIFKKIAPRPIVFSDVNGELHRDYRVGQVPFALLIVDGRVRAKGIVNSRDQLELLLEGRVAKHGEDLGLMDRGEPTVADAVPGGVRQGAREAW